MNTIYHELALEFIAAIKNTTEEQKDDRVDMTNDNDDYEAGFNQASFEAQIRMEKLLCRCERLFNSVLTK